MLSGRTLESIFPRTPPPKKKPLSGAVSATPSPRHLIPSSALYNKFHLSVGFGLGVGVAWETSATQGTTSSEGVLSEASRGAQEALVGFPIPGPASVLGLASGHHCLPVQCLFLFFLKKVYSTEEDLVSSLFSV